MEIARLTGVIGAQISGIELARELHGPAIELIALGSLEEAIVAVQVGLSGLNGQVGDRRLGTDPPSFSCDRGKEQLPRCSIAIRHGTKRDHCSL